MTYGFVHTSLAAQREFPGSIRLKRAQQNTLGHPVLFQG